jgi:N-methylhydantoinase A
VDPRRFTLLAFGGASGLHITDVARQLEIRRVVLPRLAAVLSAWGMLTTDLRYEVVRTQIGGVHKSGLAGLRRIFVQMEAEGKRRLRRAFQGPVRIHRALEMRYGEQIFEINVSLDGLDLAAPEAITEIIERFHRRHEELYTYSIPDQEVVMVNARLTVVGELPEMRKERAQSKRRNGAPAKPHRHRRIYLDRWQQVPIFELAALAPGETVRGPAIVEAPTTTVLLRRNDSGAVTGLGWLDIQVA